MKAFVAIMSHYLAYAKKQLVSVQAYGEKFLIQHTAFLGKWRHAIARWLKRVGGYIHKISPKWLRKTARVIAKPFGYFGRRITALKNRRPHRSFRLTKRRDYARSLELPGYWSFTMYTFRTLWARKKLFGPFVLLYAAIYAVVAGIGAQDAYSQLLDTLKQTNNGLFTGVWGALSQAVLLLAATLKTGFTPDAPSTMSASTTDAAAQSIQQGGGISAQGLLISFFGFMAWLTVVWLLRKSLAGHKVTLKDGIYNSGAPIIPTIIVGVILILQLLPISILILIYNAAATSELISGGVEAMLFWAVFVLICVGILYWMTSTIVGLVVVTLPGMSPLQAIRTSGDLVIGRRLRVLFRLVWMIVVTIVIWLIITIPIIIFDSWFKTVVTNITWLPIVPIVIVFMVSLTILWSAAYIYLLYRKVVEDDASPA